MTDHATTTHDRDADASHELTTADPARNGSVVEIETQYGWLAISEIGVSEAWLACSARMEVQR